MHNWLTLKIDRHGKQGVLNTASNSQLENEFGTKNEDEVMKKILENGTIQSSEVRSIGAPPHTPLHMLIIVPQNPERIGNTNDTKGAMQAH